MAWKENPNRDKHKELPFRMLLDRNINESSRITEDLHRWSDEDLKLLYEMVESEIMRRY